MRRTLPTLALTTLTTVAAFTAGAHAAGAGENPSSLTFTGRGYGHGHGLSQYGAEGAARQGLTWRQITDFYYPGTAHGTAGGKLRVKVTTQPSRSLVVDTAPRLRVRDRSARRTMTLPDNGAAQWRLKVRRDGRTAVSWRTDGSRWRRHAILAGDGQLNANGPLTVHRPTPTVKTYRGGLRWDTSTGQPVLVNVLGLDAYVRGVVPLEIPALWSRAAVASQAVVARTYAAFERAYYPNRAWHLCDTTACQVYGGVLAEHPAADAAVRLTRRQILTHDGDPAFTQFSASNGGWTTTGSRPYLTAQADPYDGWSGNPVHTWTKTVTDDTLGRAFPAIGDFQSLRVTSRDGNGPMNGRALTVVISGTAGTARVTGDVVRVRLGLRSSWFRVDGGA